MSANEERLLMNNPDERVGELGSLFGGKVVTEKGRILDKGLDLLQVDFPWWWALEVGAEVGAEGLEPPTCWL
jgi:hypothetical protein